MNGISVIMASYLGEYPSCAKDRVTKFHRAVLSFTVQSFDNTELIIVSDGCDITVEVVKEKYARYHEQHPGKIRLLEVQRTDHGQYFMGNARNAGLQHAKYDTICYLDTDDYLGLDYLDKICSTFPGNCDWVYCNDYVVYKENDQKKFRERDNIMAEGRIGTSSIIHKKELGAEWRDGYGHDWKFIEQLQAASSNYTKIQAPGYYVCHIPGQTDF